MLANNRRFADDNTRTMIDEKVLANLRPGVDFDTRLAVGILGHDAGNNGNLHLVQNMGNAVNGNGKQTGIRENNLRLALCRRIPFKNSINIRFSRILGIVFSSVSVACSARSST